MAMRMDSPPLRRRAGEHPAAEVVRPNPTTRAAYLGHAWSPRLLRQLFGAPMTPTHAEVLAAIDKARPPLETSNFTNAPAFHARNAHCDDLRATAERHTPGRGFYEAHPQLVHCLWCTDPSFTPWPCPDYQQVIDRLTGWGVLETDERNRQ
jgi:hypothetical protein